LKRIITLALVLVPLFFAARADNSGPAVSGPGFTLNPNPVNGAFFDVNLDFTEAEYPSTIINITNVLGQVVWGYQLKHVDFVNGKVRIYLDDAKLDKGVYFVQLTSGEATKTLKLAVR
jgi:hypothetical protein